MDNEDEYMIAENAPITNTYVSVPPDMGQLNCASFLAGIIEGILDGAQCSAKVTAHLVSSDTGDKTIYLIKFNSDVMIREKNLG